MKRKDGNLTARLRFKGRVIGRLKRKLCFIFSQVEVSGCGNRLKGRLGSPGCKDEVKERMRG